nr:hypothetical protein PU94_08380 [Coprobacter secundus]
MYIIKVQVYIYYNIYLIYKYIFIINSVFILSDLDNFDIKNNKPKVKLYNYIIKLLINNKLNNK